MLNIPLTYYRLTSNPARNGVLDYVHGLDLGVVMRELNTYTRRSHTQTYLQSVVQYDHKIQHSFKHWYVFGCGVVPVAYKDPIMVSKSECVIVKGYMTDVIGDEAQLTVCCS